MDDYQGIPLIIDHKPYCEVEELGVNTKPTAIIGKCNLRKYIFVGEGELETKLDLYLFKSSDFGKRDAVIKLYAGSYGAEIAIRKRGNKYFLEEIYSIHGNIGREVLLQIDRPSISPEELYHAVEKFTLEKKEEEIPKK